LNSSGSILAFFFYMPHMYLVMQMLKLSGILALVFLGVVMAAIGQYYVSRPVQQNFSFFWSWLDWAATTIIFFVSGVIVASEVYKASPRVIRGEDWGWAILIWMLLLASTARLFFFLRPGCQSAEKIWLPFFF
jgi:NhaP-type Na+/H+ or K+/H+ antiporter